MPRKAIDSSKTIIYKIVCNDLTITDFYIGLTTNFKNRKDVHKNHCNHLDKKHIKLYSCINENGGWDNWIMIMIEEFNCDNRNQARAREHYWITQLKPTLNTKSSLYISFDGDTTQSLKSNVDKTNFRNKKDKEELILLKKENKRLKELLDESLISY